VTCDGTSGIGKLHTLVCLIPHTPPVKSANGRRLAPVGFTTTWTWDTAANGIGKLHTLASPDGQKSYAYNALSQLESLSLAIDGESDVLQAKLGYDTFGRVATINYPKFRS
jgi:hypothetical protein